jgi:hypothetical protein
MSFWSHQVYSVLTWIAPVCVVYFYSPSIKMLLPLYDCTIKELAVTQFLIETVQKLNLSLFLIQHVSGSCPMLLPPIWVAKIALHVFWRCVRGYFTCSQKCFTEMAFCWWTCLSVFWVQGNYMKNYATVISVCCRFNKK